MTAKYRTFWDGWSKVEVIEVGDCMFVKMFLV